MKKQLERYESLIPYAKQQEVQRSKEGKEDIYPEDEEFVKLLAEHPIIRAYEQHIYDLEKVNKEMKETIEILKRDHEKLARDAEEDRQKLLQKTEELAKINEQNLSSEGLYDYLGEQTGKEIQGILETLKKEQEVLLNEVELTRSKAAKLDTDLKVQTQLSEEFESKYKSLNNKSYEIQTALEVANHDKEIISNKLNLKLEELRISQNEKEEYYSEKIRQEGQIRLLERSVEQYKAAYEELEGRKAGETDLLEKELSEKSIGLKELKSRLLSQEREIDELKDTNKRLQRDLDQTKTDFTQMLKIMEDNETKIAIIDEREKTLKTKELEIKKMLGEAKLAKEEAIQKEKLCKKHAAAMEQQWKDDAEERQKKYDTLLDTGRAKQKAVLKQRDDEYSALNDKFLKLQAEYDKLFKDCKIIEEEKNKASSALSEGQRSLNDRCSIYDQQIREIERKAQEEKRKMQANSDEIGRDLGKANEKLKENEQQNRVLKQQLELSEKKVHTVETELKDIKGINNELTLEKQSALKEIDRLKKITQSKMNEASDIYNLKVK